MIPTNVESTQERKRIVIAKETSVEAYKAYTWGDYYPKRWKSLMKNESSNAGFNFYAFLLTYKWFFFRKMPVFGVVLMLLEIAATVGGNLAVSHFRVSHEYALIIVAGSLVILMLFSGLVANRVYFNQARKVIESYISSRVPDEYFGEALRSDGGTSLGNFLLSVFVSGVVYSMLNAG
ncbi:MULTISPECIES: DUF2628 domain-containing protein [Aeromonas]|uniref:DUF2628 domain-containing protein n=2 Tax=Aeromonas TaxID=642 RepID=A0ABS7VC75_9GAMM|nr:MULTISPECIES: DUF2628 domain-containing protein [Aeromonas]ENY73719.1 hypothetical protein G114_01654 [Aeromonas diversa CDC 2478-85]MBZ6066987.1 DUF2628 domain-containing protein [Aeromonas schubertii]MBZ6073019.1 DUF2628 domain-containing protein [Aeromonas schubertii]